MRFKPGDFVIKKNSRWGFVYTCVKWLHGKQTFYGIRLGREEGKIKKSVNFRKATEEEVAKEIAKRMLREF